MTQNLRIINKKITYEDSDMTNGEYTIPASSSPTSSYFQCNDGYASKVQNYAYNNGSICGGVYTWYTATALSGTPSMSSGNATSSICPKSWRLPKQNEAEELIRQYGNTTSRPFALLDCGVNGSYTLNSGSTNVWYWTSTVTSNLFVGSIHETHVCTNCGCTSLKGNGEPIRCIATN